MFKFLFSSNTEFETLLFFSIQATYNKCNYLIKSGWQMMQFPDMKSVSP